MTYYRFSVNHINYIEIKEVHLISMNIDNIDKNIILTEIERLKPIYNNSYITFI